MARNWEDAFSNWAKPPGKTEEQRIDNAIKAIKNAIAASPKLDTRNIRVFTQGSYRNNTNVRQDSDVDVGIVCLDVFYADYPEGTTAETFGDEDADYNYITFKNELDEALVNYFGRQAVKRGNKAFDLKENSYHVEADVAPFFQHRRYYSNGEYEEGVELRTDNGNPSTVINWPEQHYSNGVEKNIHTGRSYKSVVRILKKLSNEMEEAGIQQAKNIMGFLIECLVWNIPNENFNYSTWYSTVRACLAFLFNNTRKDEECVEWGEVSELKYLFQPSQKWNRQQAHNFIDAAWDYVGFED